MKNYAGHRLSPWLGHLMVSRTETARALLTPGEVMQLPPGDELIMAAGIAPIRARKARYYRDHRFTARILAPPVLALGQPAVTSEWHALAPITQPAAPARKRRKPVSKVGASDAAAGIRQEAGLPDHEDIANPPEPPPAGEFDFADEGGEEDAARSRHAADRAMSRTARVASLDPGDGVDL